MQTTSLGIFICPTDTNSLYLNETQSVIQIQTVLQSFNEFSNFGKLNINRHATAEIDQIY